MSIRHYLPWQQGQSSLPGFGNRCVIQKDIGHNMSASLSAEGAVKALEMGLKQCRYKDKELIHQSDRGLQYCNDDNQKVLVKKKIKWSMTESYDPYANAVGERVNGIIKQEFNLDEYDVKLPIMKELVKDSINVYNTKRPHLSC